MHIKKRRQRLEKDKRGKGEEQIRIASRGRIEKRKMKKRKRWNKKREEEKGIKRKEERIKRKI